MYLYFQVDDGEYFQTLPENSVFIFLRSGEIWRPEGTDAVRVGKLRPLRVEGEIEDEFAAEVEDDEFIEEVQDGKTEEEVPKQQQPSLNIEYPDPNDPAIVDLAVAGSIVRRPERPKVYGGPKKRLKEEEEEAMEEDEMTLELDEESSNEDAKSERDAEEMEVAATEEDDETGTIQDVWFYSELEF